MRKKSIQRLIDLYMEYSRQRCPNIPDIARSHPMFKDSTANGLTRCIVEFLNLSGWQAERINCQGKIIDNRKTFVDTVGFRRQIGTIKYAPTAGQKGTADISATILGRSVKIEVKIGTDRQSLHQKEYQRKIEKSGGIYIIAKDFDGFILWYDNFIELTRTA